MSAARPSTAYKPLPPACYGRWLGLGILISSIAAAFSATDCATFEFWPSSLGFILLVWWQIMVVALPCYLALAGGLVVVHSRSGGRAWSARVVLLGPPLLALAAVILNLLYDARPGVRFVVATGRGAPASVRHFHHAHGQGRTWERHVAWFEIKPADLTAWIENRHLVVTNELSLTRILHDDRKIGQTSLPSKVPQAGLSVCYSGVTLEDSISADRYLFTTPEHDQAVWVYRHDR